MHIKRRTSAGMTLIEVLVALVIVAVALSAAIASSSNVVIQTEYLQQRSIAHWVAMNRATELQLELTVTTGENWRQADMLGQQWNVRTNIKPTSDNDILRAEVSVFKERDDEESISSVVTFLGRQK